MATILAFPLTSVPIRIFITVPLLTYHFSLSSFCALPPSPRQTRLLNTNDTLMAVVSLVESQFWMRRNDRVGALQKYVDSAWRTVAASDRAALCKTEVWQLSIE